MVQIELADIGEVAWCVKIISRIYRYAGISGIGLKVCISFYIIQAFKIGKC